MELFEALRRRRMTREFDKRPVPAALLERLVYAASRAPSAGNVLIRALIVVADPKEVRLLRAVTPSFLANATAAIVICTDLERAEREMGRQTRDVLSLVDAGAAGENILLAAESLGLGACFLRSSVDAAIRELLELPARFRVDIVVALGFPIQRKVQRIRARKAPVPVIYAGRYGVPWQA